MICIKFELKVNTSLQLTQPGSAIALSRLQSENHTYFQEITTYQRYSQREASNPRARQLHSYQTDDIARTLGKGISGSVPLMMLPQETKHPKKSSATLILITREQEQSFVKIITSLLLQNTIELEHNKVKQYINNNKI